MKTLYFDCFSGISGDMFLGAMLDLGVDAHLLLAQLKLLNLTGYEVEICKDQRKGITGTRVHVKLLDEAENPNQDHHGEHHHDGHHHHADTHHHSHGHHHHHDDHHQSHGHHHSHPHRTFGDIKEMILSSSLNQRIKALSLQIFEEVARAEGKVHGKPIEEVHFHEVGAVDSIVDIVGAAICVDLLGVDQILFSPIAVGGGFVNCAHGRFPVPAPATAEILKGVPLVFGGVEKELTTPTGAAIAKVLAKDFTKEPQITIQRIGYGIGMRDNPIPNVLRVYLGTLAQPYLMEKAQVLECNIDDCNPETLPYVIEKLMDLGAMDAWLTNILMKKGRPGVTLSVLCSEQMVNSLLELIFQETTTIGLRMYPVTKSMLERKSVQLETPYGPVTFKTILQGNQVLKGKPEFEDCKRIAKEQGIPLPQVYSMMQEIYRNHRQSTQL